MEKKHSLSVMSCNKLAQEYASETGLSIPDASASINSKRDWLLKSTWGCQLPGSEEFVDAKTCQANNDVSNSSTHVANRPAMLNRLKEEGFLYWVNNISYGCMNHVNGRIYDIDKNTGLTKVPDSKNENVPSACIQECRRIRGDSSDEHMSNCTHCIALNRHKNCSSKSSSPAMIRLGIECLTFLGDDEAFDTTNDAHVVSMMNCIYRQSNPKPLTKTVITLIIIGSVLFVLFFVALMVYFLYWKKRKNQSKEFRG